MIRGRAPGTCRGRTSTATTVCCGRDHAGMHAARAPCSLRLCAEQRVGPGMARATPNAAHSVHGDLHTEPARRRYITSLGADVAWSRCRGCATGNAQEIGRVSHWAAQALSPCERCILQRSPIIPCPPPSTRPSPLPQGHDHASLSPSYTAAAALELVSDAACAMKTRNKAASRARSTRLSEVCPRHRTPMSQRRMSRVCWETEHRRRGWLLSGWVRTR